MPVPELLSAIDECSAAEATTVSFSPVMEEELVVMEVWLVSSVLPLVGGVSLIGFLSICAFKLCHQDAKVEDDIPGLVLLEVVLEAPTKGDFLRWQRSHRIQNPRASEDLRIYSRNRYTPRKAVMRVKIHSAG